MSYLFSINDLPSPESQKLLWTPHQFYVISESNPKNYLATLMKLGRDLELSTRLISTVVMNQSMPASMAHTENTTILGTAALSPTCSTMVMLITTSKLLTRMKLLTNDTKPFCLPLKYWEIYVDYVCGLTQGNRWTWRAVKLILFQGLIKVFCTLDNNNTKFQQELTSVKKLKKGYARWTTTKVILDWLLDTISKIILLLNHCATRLLEILNVVPPTQRSIVTKA